MMDAKITSARLTLSMKVVRQISMQDNWIAKGALLCNPLQLQSERMEARPQSLHEEHVLLFGKLDQGFRLRRVGRGRLLAQNVLSGIQRVDRVFVVKGVRGSWTPVSVLQPLS